MGCSIRAKNWSDGATLVLFFVIFIIAFFISSINGVCRDWAYICENTGSHKGYREWFFGLRTGYWYRESHLEAFIKKNYPSEFMSRWTSYAGTGKNILGQSVLSAHGRPGPIHRIREEVFNSYVESLSPDKRLALYRLFASGDRKKIEDVVSQIEEYGVSAK